MKCPRTPLRASRQGTFESTVMSTNKIKIDKNYLCKPQNVLEDRDKLSGARCMFTNANEGEKLCPVLGGGRAVSGWIVRVAFWDLTSMSTYEKSHDVPEHRDKRLSGARCRLMPERARNLVQDGSANEQSNDTNRRSRNWRGEIMQNLILVLITGFTSLTICRGTSLC